MADIGTIETFTLYPPYGAPGTGLSVTAPASSIIDFTAQAFSVYFIPDVPPPGAIVTGGVGTTFFGYPATFSVDSAKQITVFVPQLATNPLDGLVPGHYGVIATANIGYVAFGGVIVTPPGAGIPHPPGAWFTDLHAPYIPVGSYVPYPWTYWYDAPGHPCTDTAFWSDPTNWPVGQWHWGALPPPPPGWHVEPDANHGWVLVRSVPWGNPASPPPPPAGWPPWQASPPPPPAKPAPTPLPHPVPNAPPPAPPAPMSLLAPSAPGRPSMPSPTPPGVEEPTEPRPQAIVRWLVERFAPVREPAPPDMVDLRAASIGNALVPITEEVPIVSAASPPVRRLDCVISAQLLDEEYKPVPHKFLTFAFSSGPPVPGDTSRLFRASSARKELVDELAAGAMAFGDLFAETDAEGKAFVRLQIALLDEASLPSLEARLKGIEVTIDDQPPGGPVVPVALTTATPTGVPGAPVPPTTTSTTTTTTWGTLRNIFVEPLEHAVDVVADKVGGALRAVGAAVPRTFQKALGFALKRFADGYVAVSVPVLSVLAPSVRDAVRPIIVGVWLGIPRGVWAMGRDQLTMVKQIVVDLPRALWDFIAEDPKFACEVAGSLMSPITAEVVYALDKDFRDKVNHALGRFVKFAETLPDLLTQLWQAVSPELLKGFISATAQYFYDGFKKMVGSIATDYLDYAEDQDEFRHFVYGFMAGDFIGYIIGTIGIEALKAYVSAGVATVATSLSKLAWIGPVVQKFAQLVKVIGVIKEAVEAVVGAALGAIKQGIVRVLLALAKVVETIASKTADLLVPLIDLVIAESKKVFAMIMSYAKQDSELITSLTEGMLDVFSASEQAEAREILEEISVMVEEGFVAAC